MQMQILKVQNDNVKIKKKEEEFKIIFLILHF